MKKERIGFKNLLLFIAASIGFIAIGIGIINISSKEQQRVKDWPTVEAQITGFIERKKDDSNFEHEIYVSYDINGEYHTNVRLYQYDSTVMKPDAVITVKYNPSNHNEVVYSTSDFNAVTVAVGSAFIVIGAAIPTGLIVSKVVKKKKAKQIPEAETIETNQE